MKTINVSEAFAVFKSTAQKNGGHDWLNNFTNRHILIGSLVCNFRCIFVVV